MGASSSFMSDNAPLAAYGVSIIIAILLAGYYYYDNKFKYFARLGLKNPKPLPVVGNLLSLTAEDRMVREKKHFAECGKFYGLYLGTKPRFIVADPELLRQICIKDFDKFPNHEASKLLNDYHHRLLFFMQDDKWKSVRVLVSPIFTSGKIKRMYKLLNACADDLIDCFQDQLNSAPDKTKSRASEAVVDLKDTYNLYTMDAIASCGYGLKLERKGKAIREDFVGMVMRLFHMSKVRILLAFSLSAKLLHMFGFKIVPKREIEPLADKVRRMIKTRRGADKKSNDYLQLLLDAKLDDQMELSETDTSENHHAGLTGDSQLADQKRMVNELNGGRNETKLSEEDIVGNAIQLLFGGLETTSTLLTNCTYALAFHPDIQERLYKEIKSIAEPDATKTGRYVFDYDTLIECKYLDAVVSETFRALSPVMRMDRVAKEDYHVQKYNVTIPKGSVLFLAVYAIMNDPDNWPEPEKFDPERFMPGQRNEIVPGSYCPFGLGPRHCIGMRFSLTEGKLALAKIVMKYKFEPAPGTVYPPMSRPEINMNMLKDPRVLVKLRN